MSQRATSGAAVLSALAALAAGPARAQSVAFGPPLPVPSATAPTQIALAPWTAPPALDLFVGEPRFSVSGSAAHLYRRGDLAPLAFPWASPLVAATCFTAGSWVGSAGLGALGDGLADLGWCYSSALGYQFSSGLPLNLTGLYEIAPTGLAFGRLLDRSDLVLAIGERQVMEIACDPRDPNFFSNHFYRYPYTPVLSAGSADTFALQPLRLGDVARTHGLHDVAWSRVGRPELFVLWTLTATATPNWGNWDGAFSTFQNAVEVRGAGTADFDRDGIPDLLAVVVPLTGSPRLMAVHNSGTPLSLNAASAVDVGAALGLVAPRFAAPLDLDGVPAAAVFDGGPAPRLHVVTANPGGGLRSWNTATDPAWGEPAQVLAGDLVGSAAADLVAVFVNATTQVATIRVWPGDLPPAIAWAGPLPGQAGPAAPLVLAVDASDPDGSVASVDLRLQGLPSGIAPVQSGSRYTFTVPAAALCGFLGSTTLPVVVRATDDLGAWREVAAPVPFSDAPALALPGAGSTRAVPLLPGGTSVVVAAQASDACGRTVGVAWVNSGLPPWATATAGGAASASLYTIAIPEAAYPAMVNGPSMAMSVTATATAGTAVSASASAQVTLAFDATGLVAAQHRSDRAALAPGELALLTTTLRSAIGVSLPQVALDDRLSGLVPAGPARVSGAQLLAEVDGPGGVLVKLGAIPGGGAPVVVELPVRLAEGSGGSSRAQALAATTGVPLSPASGTSASATRAGIACGSGGGSPLALLGLLLYMKAMRRVPARTRSTSSSTPMRRQA